jgi:ribosomal protein L16 Arg81 hydroxylase
VAALTATPDAGRGDHMTAWSLETLVDPCSAEDFFAGHFEAERLLVRRNKPDYFSDLLTLDDVDRILTTLEMTDDDVSVVNAANKIKHSDYVYGDDTINVDQVFRLHAEGATVILNHLHSRHPPLAELCAALELEFSAPFQTNVYLTPAGAQGFKPHFDTHDVFVLQVEGSKRWQLYGTPVDLALRGHGEAARRDDPGPVAEEFDLRTGDTLYIPRGRVHDAMSTDEASLHITVGVLSWTWFDLLLEAVETLAASDRDVRAALPRGFARAGFDRDSFRKSFAEFAGRIAAEVDPDQLLDRFSERFIGRRRPFLRGQMQALARAGGITPETTVGCRPYLSCLIDEDGEAVRVRFHGNEITLPPHAGAAVRHALETPRFRVCDLPGDLDDAGKVVLARRLVREGLLQILGTKAANGKA